VRKTNVLKYFEVSEIYDQL